MRVIRRLLLYAVAVPVVLAIGFVVGTLFAEIHRRVADVHEGLAFALVVAELTAIVGLFIVRRLRRRRRRLEAPPGL
jgi:hypothetical protein